MEDLSPRARRRRIALIALFMGLLCGVYWSIFGPWLDGRPITVWTVLRSLAAGLAFGGIYGVAIIEVPARLNRLGKHRPMVRGVRSGGPLVAMGCFMAVLMGGFNPGGPLVFLWFIPVGLAVGLIAAGWATRVGDSRHCPKCDYEYAFGDDADAPPRCPECGTGWLGRLVTGRKQRSVPLIGAGAGVIGAMMLLAVAMIQGSMLARVMPTPALVAYVGTAPPLGSAAWTELSARTLTADQREGLARRLLDKRSAGRRFLNYKAMDWLAAEVGAGRLSPELRERFFAEMFRGELDVPRRVRAGEPFEVGFRNTRAADGFHYKLGLYVGGFGVGDAPPTVGRRAEGFYPILIDRARPSPHQHVSAMLTADAPGRTTVRADVWLIAQTGSPREVSWNDDGTPNIPPTAAWFKQIELTHEVEVDP